MILNVRTTVSYSLFYNYRSICYVVPLRRAEMALTPNVTYNEVRRARKSDTGPSEWDNSQGVIIDNYGWLLYQNVVFLNILRVESATTVSLSWYNRRRKKYRRNSIIAWWKHSKRQLQYKRLELYSRNSDCLLSISAQRSDGTPKKSSRVCVLCSNGSFCCFLRIFVSSWKPLRPYTKEGYVICL